MKKTRSFALAIAAAVLGVISMSSVAGATPTSSHSGGANAVQTGVVRIDPDNPQVAYVTGNYKCPAGFAHLFVSVKQVADGSPDNALKLEGSSQISTGWLERHPGPDEFTCDGTWHTGTWRIDSTTEYGHGALIPGQVYVQFCWDGPGDPPAWHAYSEQFARAA
jgi:hypothetical protein